MPDLSLEIAHKLLDPGVVAGQFERGLELLQRLGQFTPPAVEFGEPANGRQIFGGLFQDVGEFAVGAVEFAQFEQGPAERDPSRQIALWRASPAWLVATASRNFPARRYSSASWANAIDAGSFWSRTRSSSMRDGPINAILVFYLQSLTRTCCWTGLVTPPTSVAVRVTTNVWDCA